METLSNIFAPLLFLAGTLPIIIIETAGVLCSCYFPLRRPTLNPKRKTKNKTRDIQCYNQATVSGLFGWSHLSRKNKINCSIKNCAISITYETVHQNMCEKFLNRHFLNEIFSNTCCYVFYIGSWRYRYVITFQESKPCWELLRLSNVTTLRPWADCWLCVHPGYLVFYGLWSVRLLMKTQETSFSFMGEMIIRYVRSYFSFE